MTDQKLVDELEKALRDEAYDGGFGYMGDEQFPAYVRTLAETAAEVVERARTPTDDERKALVAILEAPLTEGSQGRTFSEMLADVILLRFGFRSAEHEWSHCSPSLLASGLNCASTPRRPCSCSPTNGGHDHLVSEPQGEPSDAQVQAALDAATAYYATTWVGEIKPDPVDLDAMRAALRAAGVGGER